jgi:hypothetical protein
VPSLFARKTSDAVTEAPAAAEAESGPNKGRTPSKRELGQTTPKRRETTRRAVEKAPVDRREAAKRMREKSRQERIEAREGMAKGDEKYLLARDRGPERKIARDVVDSRHTIGTWFFGVVFLVMLIGFTGKGLNNAVYLAANGLFVLLLLATLVDSYLISRQVKKLVLERHPDTKVRMRSLYIYAAMRAISFRGIRSPKPQVKFGEKI